MSILRFLIIKEWYRSFSAAVIALFLLISIANLISGLLRGNVSTTEVLMNYLLELPSIMAKILPLGCLMGTMFSLNKIRSRNELAAIFASGFSRKKFVATIIMSAIPVVIFEFALLGYIDPFLKQNKERLLPNAVHKFRNLTSGGLSASTIGSGQFWYKTKQAFISFRAYDKNNKSIKNYSIYSISYDQKLKIIAKGNELRFRDNNWISDSSLIISDLDIEGFHNELVVKNSIAPLSEKAADLEQIESDITTLDFAKLYSYIRSLAKVGINVNEYLTIFLDKINNSLMCLIFSPNRRGASFGIGIAAVFIFTIFYWLFYSYLFELGKSSKLNPFIAVFAVSSIFLLGILNLFVRNRNLR
jgi:lipopolysaccharide export system permease protein